MTAVVDVRQAVKTFVQSGAFPWSNSVDVHAVRGVDLVVEQGEVVALVGQSGSGKTTLSRMILGLEEPTSGEIHLGGNRWSGISERERHPYRVDYQYVPQDAMSALDPQQTALEHVVETLKSLRGLSGAEAEESAKEMLNRLGLGERFMALPREMSGGEQRRITLARVLSLTPKLVVADEPTSGLEPDRREAVLRDLIGNLPKEAGCVLVTHDMGVARKWANRCLVMLDGRVIEELDLRQSEPTHPYSMLLFNPWEHPVPEGELSKTGCPFQGDCARFRDNPSAPCASTLPELTSSTQKSHRVACHLPEISANLSHEVKSTEVNNEDA
jgi:ABC-type glutathione transport system ATPase component